MASLSERPTPAGIETTEGDQVFRNPIITFVGAAASIPPYRTAVLRARPAKAFPISRRRPAASHTVRSPDPKGDTPNCFRRRGRLSVPCQPEMTKTFSTHLKALAP